MEKKKKKLVKNGLQKFEKSSPKDQSAAEGATQTGDTS